MDGMNLKPWAGYFLSSQATWVEEWRCGLGDKRMENLYKESGQEEEKRGKQLVCGEWHLELKQETVREKQDTG